MNRFKTLKRLALVVLLTAGVITLTACKSSDATPYGNISDDVYMSIGDIKITERELYDQLRMQGAQTLSTMIDELVFAEEMATVRGLLLGGDEKLNEFLDNTINSALHGLIEKEDLEKLYTDDVNRFKGNIEQFVDSLYLLDNNINISALIAAIQNLTVPYEGYSSISSLLDRYVLRVAQREFARSILINEVDDAENANHISEANLVNYYKSNLKDQYEVDALVVRFINLNEANAALYQASIKSDSRGLWYKIPDIRIVSEVDLNDTSENGFGHVKSILEELNILSKLGPTYEDRSQISILDYENYYKKYVISTSRTTGRDDKPLTTVEVKEAFVSIYNSLNPAAQVEVNLVGSIVGKDGSTFTPTYTFEELNKINVSLRTHIYSTLTAEANMEDSENVTTEKPYSSRIQTFGTSRYLVFKLADDKASEEGILIPDPEDSEKEIFSTIQAALDVKAEVKEEIFNSFLSDQYITTKMNEKYEDVKIDIYDPVVRIFYEQAYGYEGTTKNRGGDVIASIDGSEIKVDTYFTALEKAYGINLALDLASNKYLLANEKYSVTTAQLDTFKKQFEDIISQFSADNFASSGFPASMGRERFLINAFGARTNSDAINQLYVYPELRQQYLNDYENHYGNASKDFYDLIATLTQKQYDNFKSINVSHLLIYIDENGDGTPDNPKEYLEKLGVAGAQKVKDGLVDLVKLLYTKVGDYKGLSEGLQGLANEFNNSGRLERGSIVPPYDYQLELVWAEFRQLGFYLKFESLPNAITNTSNFLTSQTLLDEVFYDRAMQIHNTLSSQDPDDSKFPYLDMYSDTLITETVLNDVQSSFGWHLILATSVTDQVSAQYKADNDESSRYVSEDGTLNAYNENPGTLTASQIKYYMTEQKNPEGVVLPTEVQTAITNYLTPVLSRYNSSNNQRELIFKLLESATFSSATGAQRFNVIRAINVRQINGYLLSSNDGIFDPNYNVLYGDWFTVLQGN